MVEGEDRANVERLAEAIAAEVRAAGAATARVAT
jgi:hypothetical protein